MELEIDERALAVTLLLRLSGAACLAVHLSVCLSVYLSLYLSVCLSVYLSLCLSKDGATTIMFSFDDTFHFLSSFLFLS